MIHKYYTIWSVSCWYSMVTVTNFRKAEISACRSLIYSRKAEISAWKFRKQKLLKIMLCLEAWVWGPHAVGTQG